MSTLYLVRHGQASAGTDHYDRLSATGRRQAGLLGEWWRAQGFRAHAAFAGSLERQQDTAAIALQSAGIDLPVGIDDDLNEYDHHTVDRLFGEGSRSDMPDDLTFGKYLLLMQRWLHAESHHLEGSEAWHAFTERGWRVIHKAHQQRPHDGRFVLFTSGGVIATVLQHVLGLDFERTIDAIWMVRNASITTLDYDGERARLIGYNAVGHLELHRDESLITLI